MKLIIIIMVFGVCCPSLQHMCACVCVNVHSTVGIMYEENIDLKLALCWHNMATYYVHYYAGTFYGGLMNTSLYLIV